MIRYGGAVCGKEERKALIKSIDKSIISRNWQEAEEGKLFSSEAAKFLGVKHCVLTNSGSSAGLLALSALELPKGSEVIISAVTFPTIFNIIIQCGLTPVVVDAQIGTYGFDVKDVERAVTKKTKAIIAIHPLGNPVDMPALMKLVKKYEQKIWVVEDNCLAEGTLIKTGRGDIPIEKVRVGDRVLTRKGYRKVLRTLYRGKKEVITKLGITATADHPFIHTKGVKSLDGLYPSDILYIWNEKSSCIEEKSITDILNQNIDTKESIIGLEQRLGLWVSIARNGLIISARFLKECLSTIKTEIRLIMRLPILNSLHPSYIVNTTLKTTDEMLSPGKILPLQEIKLSYGTHLQKVGRGIVDRVYKDGPKERKKVYDLEIEEEHEFFANGILVHNCDGWGTTIGGRKAGAWGDVSITSFHAAHIVSMGVGGGVFTNDKALARRIRMYRDWGRQADINESRNTKHPSLPNDYNPRFIYEKLGYNFQVLELQAAMGRVQLRKIDKIKKARQKNFEYLHKHLSKYPELIMPETIKGADVCWFAFPLTTKGERGPLLRHLKKNGIETRPMFSGNICLHSAYKHATFRVSGKLDGANCIVKKSWWISCHPSLTHEDKKYIVEVFESFFSQEKGEKKAVLRKTQGKAL